MRRVRRGRGRRAAARLRAVAVNTDTRVDEDNTGLVVYRLLVAQVNPYNGTAMATGSGREMVRRAAFSPRRGGGGVFWGWSPAAGGALTAVRLERLGAVAVASERRVWRAMVFVRRRRRWSSKSCGRNWSRPVLGWSLRRRRGCEVLFRGTGRRSVLVVVPVSSSGWVSSRIPRVRALVGGYCLRGYCTDCQPSILSLVNSVCRTVSSPPIYVF